MPKPFIIALDQGTTSTRALLFDFDGIIVSEGRRAHEQIHQRPDWVSHNANEIFFNSVECVKKALEIAGVSASQVAAIGVANQRETCLLWDSITGEPACEAVVWQCRRTSNICAEAEADGMAGVVRERTGLIIDPYFSATKLKWMLGRHNRGGLLAGTIDSYLIWRLTGGRRHVTDYTNASRTMLFNIKTLDWDKELLEYFGVDRGLLPDLIPNAGIIGETEAGLFGAPIPIAGSAGDQHAALFGQACLAPGDVKNTYGTGCFILKNIGDRPVTAQGRLLTTLAWHLGEKAAYAFEGGVFNAGAAVEWLIRDMGLAGSVEEIKAICEETPDTDGAYFVPAFSGLGAPHWDMYARGAICGMNLSTNRRHIVRAVMESIAYSSRDVIDHMNEVSRLPVSILRADGGVSRSDFTMQFQSDLLGVPVERPAVTETTAFGAFLLAGIGVGLFKGLDEIKSKRAVERTFYPSGTKNDSDALESRYAGWKKAVGRSMGWAG
ncbi:MAG: glycerol kinase GlpK [Defluviitaleaceae bacterium]|nr:glycerol kinase GlpK [Defluviitaleaceae bacterium]